MTTKLHFRLTGDRSAKEVCEGIFKVLSESCKGQETKVAVITGFEIGFTGLKQPHTHSHIETTLSRETARDRLKKQFDCHKTQYQLKDVRSKPSNISYVTKCGNIAYSPNFETDVMKIQDITPWVFKTLEFNDRLKKLDEEYMERGTSDEDYIQQLLSLHAEFQTKHLFLHQIRSHWLALFSRRNQVSYRKTYTLTGFVEEQYYPRQMLVHHIKNFIEKY